MRPGTRIGRHVVQAIAAETPLVRSYVAIDPNRGRPYWIRVLRRETAASPPVIERYLQVLQRAGALPHVAPVYDAEPIHGTALDGLAFSTTLLLDHALLGPRPDRALDATALVARALSVLAALDAAHALGLVHGLVTPSQVRGSSTTGDPARPFLAGFGEWIVVEAALRAGDPAVLARIDARYLAPEQERGTATPASDVWALGAALLGDVLASADATLDGTVAAMLAPEPAARPALATVRRWLEQPATRPVPDDAERALLAEVRASPGEPAPRAVWADWIEQRGEEPRARLVRALGR